MALSDIRFSLFLPEFLCYSDNFVFGTAKTGFRSAKNAFSEIFCFWVSETAFSVSRFALFFSFLYLCTASLIVYFCTENIAVLNHRESIPFPWFSTLFYALTHCSAGAGLVAWRRKGQGCPSRCHGAKPCLFSKIVVLDEIYCTFSVFLSRNPVVCAHQ